MTDIERCDLEIQRLASDPHWLAALGHADWYSEKCLIIKELKHNTLAIPCPCAVKEI